MKLDPRIPEHVQPIVKEYLWLIEQRLIGSIRASYFAGFIALGGTRPTACDSIV